MSFQSIEHDDTSETTRRRKTYLPETALLGTEPTCSPSQHNHTSQPAATLKRRRPRRIRALDGGFLLFAVLALSRVIDGLNVMHFVPAAERRRLDRRHGLLVRSKNLFKMGMTSDGKESTADEPISDGEEEDDSESKQQLIRRVSQLEELVAKQEVEIQRLKRTCDGFSESLEAFARVVQVLREAGLKTSDNANDENETPEKVEASTAPDSGPKRVVESFDDAIIFGTAPSSVIDAADAAGAAILAAMLGGKQRMLVDVRDAELSADSETLVQFIELAVLPIAAGLEGLKSTRNRVKIVFPKVSQLLEYRRTMALAAPEVVALSTLGFEPVEKRDKLVVIVAPAPDDEEGLAAMNEMICPTEPGKQTIQQPVVILNHHMAPIAGLPTDFESVYHLRLLSVQFMSGGEANDYFQSFQRDDQTSEGIKPDQVDEDIDEESRTDDSDCEDEATQFDEEALEAAMQHAHELGVNHGITRAMVIRAYPRPWHVFVDVSPDTDAAFEVAAIFDEEPTAEELNFAIVECLEGSEREDEIVAQQMQQALEDGQLENVSEMIGEALNKFSDDEDEDSDDSDDDDFDMFEEDSV